MQKRSSEDYLSFFARRDKIEVGVEDERFRLRIERYRYFETGWVLARERRDTGVKPVEFPHRRLSNVDSVFEMKASDGGMDGN